MMAQAHPSDIELFEEVEGDLDPEQSAAVRAHLETCPACAATVAELEQARTVLRASPIFELPEERSRAIAAGLPRRERARPQLLEFLSSPRRLAAVLVPVAAAVVAVVVVTTTGGNGREESRAAEKTAQAPVTAPAAAEAQADAGAQEAAPATTVPPQALEAVVPVASVQGQAADVAKLLEDKGFTARVVNETTVEVTDAAEAKVKEALKGLPPGPVQVLVKPAG